MFWWSVCPASAAVAILALTIAGFNLNEVLSYIQLGGRKLLVKTVFLKPDLTKVHAKTGGPFGRLRKIKKKHYYVR